jgi:hypothetical protein
MSEGAANGRAAIRQTKTVDVHRSHNKEKLGLAEANALERHSVRWVKTQQVY